MREFVIPQYPEGLEKDHKDGRLFVKAIVPFKSKSERELNALIDGFEALVESPLEIYEHTYFDVLYSFIAKLSTLSADVRKSVSDALCRSTRAMVDLTKRTLESRSSGSSSSSSSQPSSDDTALHTHNKTLKAHSGAYKIYGFFLHWLVLEQEKMATDQSTAPVAAATTKGGRGKKKKTTDAATSSWEEADKEKVLTAMIDVLELDLASLWKANQPEEEFLNLFNKVVSSMLENQANVASKTLRQYLFVMAAQLLSRYQQHTTLIPSLVHLLYRCEHLALPLVELFELITAEYDAPIVVGEMIRELGKGTSSGAKDTGNKNVSAFMSKLAERIPKAVLPFVGTVAAQLADEAHQIRNGVVQVLGHLISKGFSQEDDDEDGTHEKQRESLLALLEERFLDVSSYTRSKVLQTWKDLITERAVPVKMLNSVTRNTVLRLNDKIAQVRKRAVLLLTAILEYNPYHNVLSVALFEQSLQESEAKLEALSQAQIERLKQSLEKTTSRRSATEQPSKKGGQKSKRGKQSETDDTEEQQDNDEAQEQEQDEERLVIESDDMDQEQADNGEELAAQEDEDSEENREIRSYEQRCDKLRGIVYFIRLFHQAMPGLTQLLGSKTATDVQETINFFVVANRFQIEAASDGISKMLPLVWSKDVEIKNAVINAYQLLFLTPPPNVTSEKAVARFVASNLTRLVGQSTITELVSFEELVTEFTRKELITPSTIKCLWSMFAMKMEGTTLAQSRNALVTLTYIANVKREVVQDNLPILTSFGLGERWKEDERFAQYTCIALQKLVNTSAADAAPTRFNSSHSLFEQLARIVKESSKSLRRWFPAAEQAINAIYTLSEQPDQVCASIIKDMTHQLRQASTTPISELTKLVFVVGHVALRQLIHLEYIQIELRRRRTLKEKHDEDKKGKPGHGSEAIEDELGVQTATEESEAEFIQQVAERQLVCKNLLGAYAPMIVRICQNTNGEYENSTLRSAAVLSLCKFMCTSATFCDANLRLLFTVLEKAPEPFVRSDIVIALSDLASRHHNLIAGWMTKLHSRLRDSDASVRKNTLMVLSHLILNEMIKPGDHISKVAQCLEDEDPRIAGSARLFFQEQNSKQVNSIYNSLPDIISSLSGSDEITKDGFKRIMQYLFQFVTQERHAESLVDKLCLRFRDCQDVASSCDIAYCLTLLSYTDKPVKKLVERFKLYQNLLIHNEIYECFLATIAKMKKTARVELRSIVDELEAKITAWHSAQVQEDGQLFAASADIAFSSVAATPATSSSSLSSSSGVAATSTKKAPATRGRRTAAAAKPAAKAKAPAARKSTRATATRGRKAKQYDSSDDDEDENASTDGNDSDIDMLV